MPRVISFRIGLLWVAFRLDDFGGVGPRRLGFTRQGAATRAAVA